MKNQLLSQCAFQSSSVQKKLNSLQQKGTTLLELKDLECKESSSGGARPAEFFFDSCTSFTVVSSLHEKVGTTARGG